MESKQFRNKTTGEIVTQFNIMDINNFEELILKVELNTNTNNHEVEAIAGEKKGFGSDGVRSIAEKEAIINIR